MPYGLSARKIDRLEKRIIPNSVYLKSLNDDTRRYMRILSKDWPAWLDDYISAPEMQRLKFLGQSCGTDYLPKLYGHRAFYSVLDHSVACALIVWHFTKDKNQTLAALFHDISTPTMKHCIDFLNGDTKTQESTEAPTSELIGNSKKIIELLKRDRLKVHHVSNYHDYPIADNDMPFLSSDRLEYSFMNCHKNTYETFFSLEDIERIYDHIEVGQNPTTGDEELAFSSISVAEYFVEGLSKIWHNWCDDRYAFVGELYARIVKELINNKELTKKSLYHLTEPELIAKIESSKSEKVRALFSAAKSATSLKATNKKPKNAAFNVKDYGKTRPFTAKRPEIKRRYLDPLVRAETSISLRTGAEDATYARLSDLSPKIRKRIDNFLDAKYQKYIYIP